MLWNNLQACPQRPTIIRARLLTLLSRRYDCLLPPQSGSIHPVIYYIIAQSTGRIKNLSRGDMRIGTGTFQVWAKKWPLGCENVSGKLRQKW